MDEVTTAHDRADAPRSGRRRALMVAGGAGAIGAACWLAFGFFGVHTLFVDSTVDEAAPNLVSDAPSGENIATLANPIGQFVGRGHATSGSASVLGFGEERVLRLEDFATDNGPDLNVYLVSAPGSASDEVIASDYVDLGDLKGNIGNQNYEIPPEVDLERYSTVVIWCVRFGVSFGLAELR